MKKENLKILIGMVVLIVVFSIWNIRLIEARQGDDFADKRAKEEILWLARVIYSETKEANEQVLIAWVVRNRVETEYRGQSYAEVAQSKGQFSGLNFFDNQYLHNISRNYESKGEAWENALEIARAVYGSPGFLRPFSQNVKHFYSPKSLSGVDPNWSVNHKPVLVIRDEDRHIRFAFYSDIK